MIWFSASCTWTNLPNSVGLGFAFANDFRVRLEHAHDLAWKMRDSLEDPGLGLLHHLRHSLGHEFQCFPLSTAPTPAIHAIFLRTLGQTLRSGRRSEARTDHSGWAQANLCSVDEDRG